MNAINVVSSEKRCIEAANECSRNGLVRELRAMQAEQERNKRRQSWLERHLVSVYEQLERAQWSSSFWKCVAFWGWAVAIGVTLGLML